MELWIIRLVALFCAAGSAGLLWVFGVFVVVPWRAGRMLALSSSELQILGIAADRGWRLAGELSISLLLARRTNPKLYAVIRTLLMATLTAAAIGGITWTPPG